MTDELTRTQVVTTIQELLEGLPEGRLSRDRLAEMMSELTRSLGLRVSVTATESMQGEDIPASWISLVDEADPGEDIGQSVVDKLPFLDAQRYLPRARIGSGGQGVVHEVIDRIMGRRVALKVIRPDSMADPQALRRFEREVRITAQLNHAGVVPIHDVGRMPDGLLAYTMKRIRGRSLREILRSVRAAREGDGEDAAKVLREFSRRRLIEVMVSACHAVGFAYARGGVHRDLKPGNLMVGDYGEVMVLDWGIARVLGTSSEESSEGPLQLLERLEDPTLQGTIKGTPGYMAPEQAAGDPDAQGPWTDVYALGLILYEVLCGEAARTEGTPEARLEAARLGRIESPEARRRRRGLTVPPVGAELEHVCLKALNRDPGERYPNAEALAGALQSYLDGEQRREMAESKARQADEKAALVKALAEDAEVARREAQLLREAVEPWMDLDRKRLVWEKEDQARSIEARRDDTLNEALALYTQALGDDPENERARAGLAALYFESLLEAESWGRDRDARRYKAQVEALDNGRLRQALIGNGRLSVRSDPSGAEVWLYELVHKDRQLIPSEGRLLGKTPVVAELPMGRYLVVLRRMSQERETRVDLPVFIQRQGVVENTVRMYSDIPETFSLVPAGPFIFGGDRRAPGSGPRVIRHTEDFAIARFPVTCQEYLEFLMALEQDDPGAARHRAPRVAVRSGHEPLWPRTRDGRLRIPRVDMLGGRWAPDMPVRCVSREDAEAYCRWRSALDDRPYRLPTELEWEKAGRGVDGRFFPWGDEFDASFCKMRDARPGPPFPEPIGAFPKDCSPYGVRDMAGGVVEWCSGPFDRHGVLGIQRGGFWMASEASCRLARRFGVFPTDPEPFCGFRLAYTPTW